MQSQRGRLGRLRPALAFGAFLALVMAFGGVARAEDGALDATFGGDGKVTTTFTNGAYANDVAVQADGLIVAAGAAAGDDFNGVFAVARYAPDGMPDPTFGGDGTVTTAIGAAGDEAKALAIQADGKIVAVGTNGDRFELARYETNGDLDDSFGTNGVVTTNPTPSWDVAYGTALQPNGKIVVAGFGTPGAPFRPRFVLARYTTAGELDPSFGGGGVLISRLGTARDVVVQPDGKIVAAGYDSSGMALARYRRDGTLDPTFGGDGTVGAPRNAGAFALALQPNGRIVAGGAFDFFAFEVVRFTAGGKLDRTFGHDGAVTTDVGGSEQGVAAIAIQPTGKIVAVGSSGPHEGGEDSAWRFVLTRYRSSGVLDPAFGRAGIVRTRFKDGAAANGSTLQADGRLVVAGGQGEFTRDAFALARYML